MSFQSKSPRVLSQQLKVQELVIKQAEDLNLYVVDSSDIIVFLDEPVASVKCVMFVDNSASSTLAIPAASISIVDSSSPYSAGGDRQAVRLASLTLAANDVLILKYVLAE